VYEQLGFKSNLKYGPRSKLRKACTRFLRFSYLLDFVAMEALYNIFVESVKETVVKLRDLAALRPDFDLKTV
jgi:dynein heavy chain, axonemal